MKAPESAFEGPCVCPKCHERGQFYDYPREVPATPPKPATRPTTTWYDRLLWGAIAIAALTALIALWSLYKGWSNSALIGSAVCLLAALAIGGHIIRLKRDLFRLIEAQKRAERALVVSNSKLRASSEIHRGFKVNFDTLVNDEKRRLQEEIAARQESTEELHSEALKQIEVVKTDNPSINAMGGRLIEEGLDRLSRHLTASNLPDCQNKLMELILFCRENGFKINRKRESELLGFLDIQYQAKMSEARHANLQEQVEEEMREDDRATRDLEEQLRSAEAERSSVQKTLASIEQNPQGAESEEADYLREKLEAAEKKAHEMAQAIDAPTSGHVYVLSNVGSLGRNVFKIGTTSHLDPRLYVKELGASAVPFPYDIHMMIATEDAASLEKALQEGLHDCRVNRFNHSKNFFQTDIKTIWQIVVANHGTVDYVSEPAAKEFEESRKMSDEAFQNITEMNKSPEKYRGAFDSTD